jgi:3'(2'), 5'-bisphosphate nucleotidase
MDTLVSKNILDALCAIAREAGAAIMEIYQRDIAVRKKADASPVTDADERAEAIILARLGQLAPAIPVVAEESMAAGRGPAEAGACFWLVDPLDGTKEFISRNGEFTVNIALIEAGRPVMGVVYAPAIERLFLGTDNLGAFVEDGDKRRAIHVRPVPPEGLTVVASRSHRDAATEDYIARFPVAEMRPAGSSLKLCLVAAGEADLYPRLGRTMEWDIAAGHAVVAAAGGSVTTLDGAPLTYGKPGYENPFFVARGAV